MEWYTWTVLVIMGITVGAYAYVYIVKDWMEYRQAKKEIFAFVKSYKPRCTGNNRFEVSAEILQDSFRGYNTIIISKVWLELVHERIIEQDKQDNTWCIR